MFVAGSVRLDVRGVAICQRRRNITAPRGPDGVHPDLNGIWQAMNEANYDLELHMARSALQEREGPHGPVPARNVLAMGAVGSVPLRAWASSKAVARFPYTPEALEKKKANQANWAELDPEVKCYMPGVPRATYMPQPFPDLSGRERHIHRLPVGGCGAGHLYGRPGPAPGRLLDGSIRRTLGRGYPCRRSHRLSTGRPGWTGPVITPAGS